MDSDAESIMSLDSSTSATESSVANSEEDADQASIDGSEVISSSDEERNVNEPDNQENDPYQPFFTLGQGNPAFLEPQALRLDHTDLEDFILAIATNVADKGTYKSLLSIFQTLNNRYQQPVHPTNKYQFWKMIGRNKDNQSYQVYCSFCGTCVGEGKKALRNCAPTCNRTGPATSSKLLAQFVHISIRAQLLELL